MDDEEEKRLQAATSSADEVESQRLIPISDEESGPQDSSSWSTTSKLRSGRGLGSHNSTVRRWILLPVRDLVRLIKKSLQPGESQPKPKRGLVVAVFGFTASRADELKETSWLDGLRGVAAFLVMVYHYHLDMFTFGTEAPYGAPGTHAWEIWRLPYLRIIWCSGHTQVGIFFVLSGFVLSWSSLSSIREGRYEKFALSLGSTAFRRWMRLFVPCFWIGILSLIQFYSGVLELTVTRRDSFLAQFVDYLWESERFANPFHLERTNWEVLHSYNTTMWTMPVEWAGSLAVFVVLLMVSRIRSYGKRTLVLAVVPIYACLSARWNYWLFTTGVLFADYVKQRGGFDQLSGRTTRRSRLCWLLVLLAGGWLGGIPGKRDWYERPGYAWTDAFIPANWQDIEGGQRYFWCWSGVLLTAGVAHFAALRRLFERPACRYLGRVSFMLYLTHRMVGTILGPPIRRQILALLGTHRAAPDHPEVDVVEIQGPVWNVLAYLLAWAVMLPLALALANWCTVLVDEPCVRFARWVDERFVSGGGGGGAGAGAGAGGEQELGYRAE
ncbi:hypothetical protein MBM_09833 [Drepanopeziza brunnea f. sp. 'multigermtubi' MB_m1]|uniref:Acyltransferase 3 domain-containing protein n=1 Tax=Marssonina brunnea f. sp. multigermtubi (strain MB_m1) TaxID=1072389 RepID=K1W4W6_MARBU|nr:uncharacterized protein MBM_09833 [Drepanopeziza brunnea f. sp. 'multigermtubi' MB_m1]EKD11970.1 hypothetical protein MBM_09833 [Drepanopeziza brunnea f. sp. 'multigermtubi' MB_m1]